MPLLTGSATAVFHRLQPVGIVSAAAASVYLTWVFIQTFFTETGVTQLVNDFIAPFFTIPVILTSLLLISNVRRKTYLPEKGRLGIFFFLTVPFYFLLTLFLVAFTVLLWTNIAGTPAASLKVMLALLAEIIAIIIAVGAQKTKQLSKVLGLLLSWSFSIMGAFCVLGIFEKQHAVAISSDLRLVFAGIFFHAGNSVYLLSTGYRVFFSRRPSSLRSR